MVAKDLMRREVLTILQDETVEELVDMVVREHIHGVPVVDRDGELVGVVTQQDIFFSAWSSDPPDPAGAGGSRAARMKVRDIMTAPAVSAEESTDVRALCRMMQRLRIHRVPIVDGGKVTGLISSLDICGAFADGVLD